MKICRGCCDSKLADGWVPFNTYENYTPQEGDLVMDCYEQIIYFVIDTRYPITDMYCHEMELKVVSIQAVRANEFADLMKMATQLDIEDGHKFMDKILVLALRGAGPEWHKGLDIYEEFEKWYA